MGNIGLVSDESLLNLCEEYKLTVNGEAFTVYFGDKASYAVVTMGKEPIKIEIETQFGFNEVKIRPLIKNVQYKIDNSRVFFELKEPMKLSVEFDNNLENPLFILVNSKDDDKPCKGDGKVIYFESGRVYEEGHIYLESGQTLYIDEDAVVYGSILAENADNISIKGRGVLNGSKYPRYPKSNETMISLINCNNVVIEGITVADGANWHVVPQGCSSIEMKNVNVVSFTNCGDGIDVTYSKDVTIDNCFIRSKDDCIAIKAHSYKNGSGNVENVKITNSVFWNGEWGNALEIGYETTCESISNIVFKNCDVIHSEFEGYESGGTFTIHNGDRAIVSNVLYEDIRVEDSQEKLIDIKILCSQYSRDEERGQVNNIRFKNIKIVDGLFPVSIIRGYDGNHLINDILIEDLYFRDKKITSTNEAKMVVEISKGVRFV
jgi:polygalacturonase